MREEISSIFKEWKKESGVENIISFIGKENKL